MPEQMASTAQIKDISFMSFSRHDCCYTSPPTANFPQHNILEKNLLSNLIRSIHKKETGKTMPCQALKLFLRFLQLHWF